MLNYKTLFYFLLIQVRDRIQNRFIWGTQEKLVEKRSIVLKRYVFTTEGPLAYYKFLEEKIFINKPGLLINLNE